jgi:hypothetical protein
MCIDRDGVVADFSARQHLCGLSSQNKLYMFEEAPSIYLQVATI